MNEAMHFEAIMHDKHKEFEVDDRVEQAYRAGYEAGYLQLETKYWDSQRLIDQCAAENKRMKELMWELILSQRKNCSECDVEMLSEECKARPDGSTCFKWKHLEEAIKLINEDSTVSAQ